MSLRMEKIDHELQKQLMDIIQREIDDPLLEFLSITRVRTTADLQESKVYFSLLQDDKYDQALKTLAQMKGFIRASLAKRIRLKILPKLAFFPDESIKYSVEIYQKIEEIKKQDAEQSNKENNSSDT